LHGRVCEGGPVVEMAPPLILDPVVNGRARGTAPVRQESLVEEEGGSDLKLRRATQGESPTGDVARPPRRKRVLRDRTEVHGRPWSRSVDSGRTGHAIGSRNTRVVGAEPSGVRQQATGMRRCATSKAERRGLERIRQPGSQNVASTQGSSRNLGWSLGTLSGDRNDTARGHRAGRVSRGRSAQ
jgi:hypothetical protein